MPQLSLLALNIANPSPERAERQLGWLAARDEDILVRTETKDSAGCRLLADAFRGAGYHISYPKPDHGDYGVMIVSRVQARGVDFGDRVGYLVSRAAAITLPAPNGPIQLIGAYVPLPRCQPRENRAEEEMAGRLHRRPLHPRTL